VEPFLDFGFAVTQILGCLAVAVGGRVQGFGPRLIGHCQDCFGDAGNSASWLLATSRRRGTVLPVSLIALFTFCRQFASGLFVEKLISGHFDQ